MINSTLGGLIKDYRLQKGISQLDIAFALGWKETSRISRIEQGKTEKPSRELLDKIMNAIGLEEQDKNTLLLTGSYLPTEEEIAKVIKETGKMIDDWPYPSGLYDFSWRIIKKNDPNIQIYQYSPEQSKMLGKSHPRILDHIFLLHIQNYEILEKKYSKQFIVFLKTVVSQFKYEQRHRTKEKWYIDHVRKLMNNQLFREIWSENDISYTQNQVVNKFVVEHIVNPKDHNKLLNFYLFVVPVLKDPRFEVEFMIPMDQETFKFFQ